MQNSINWRICFSEPNPAKGISTPPLPTKGTRDDGNRIRTTPPRGIKK